MSNPTEKQVAFLKKNHLTVPATFEEAKERISDFIKANPKDKKEFNPIIKLSEQDRELLDKNDFKTVLIYKLSGLMFKVFKLEKAIKELQGLKPKSNYYKKDSTPKEKEKEVNFNEDINWDGE